MTQIRSADTAHRALVAVLGGMLWMLCACHKAPPVETEAVHAQTTAKPEAASAGIAVPEEQAQKLGITVQAAQAVDYTAETAGYGVVLPHEAIAAAVAELTTAELTERQAHAALARARSLNGTPGALSAEVEETASRQSAADTAAVTLATQRLSAIVGLNPAWKAAERDSRLQDLANGKTKLLRASFPLGAIRGSEPKSLRATHLDALQGPAAPTTRGPTLTSVWDAPADASVPGRSFFALLKGTDFVEGERLLVWAPGAGPTTAGVLIPAAAVVISDGKYWCFVEKQPAHYIRVEVNTDRPLPSGYVVSEGVEVGAKVVTSAAGLLLAQESHSDTDAD